MIVSNIYHHHNSYELMYVTYIFMIKKAKFQLFKSKFITIREKH